MLNSNVNNENIKSEVKFPNSLYFYFGLIVIYLIVMLFIDSKVHLWILSGIFIAILALYVYKKQKLYNETYSWTSVEGHLKKINLVKSFCSMYESFSTKKNIYEIEVEYTYRYNEQSFTGNIYSLGQPCNYHYDYSKAVKIIKKIEENKNSLQIKINPKNPAQSILVAGVQNEYTPSYTFVLLVYGGIFLFIPLIF